MKKSKLVLGLALLASSYSAHALNLLETYALAVKNDIQLAQAGSKLEQTLNETNAAYANVLPSVSFTYDWSLRRDLSLAKNFQQQFSTVSIGLRQNLFNVAAFKALDVAKKTKALGEMNYVVANQSLISRTMTAYLEVLKAKTSVETTKQQLSYINKLAESFKVQYKNGLIAEADLNMTLANVEQVKAALGLAEVSLETKIRNLKEIIGDNADTSTLYKFTTVGKYNVEHNPQLQATNNLNVKLAQMNKVLADDATFVAKTGHLPTVSLTGQLSNGNNTVQLNEKGWVDAHKLDNVYVGLNVTVPVFAGGSTYYGVKSKEAAANYAQQSYELALKQVTNSIENNYKLMQAQYANINYYQTSVKAYKQSLNAKEVGYRNGVVSLVNYLEVTNSYFKAMNDLESANYDYLISQVTQKQLIGALEENDIIELNKVLTVPVSLK